MARATREAGDVPAIAFVAEAERCPVCDGALKLYKSRSRRVITLAAGPFRAIETLKQCRTDSSHPILGSQSLARLVKPRQHGGYDLIVHVGRARYLEHKQRGEIQAELCWQRGIELSTGSICYLCDRFLTHLQALHLARVPQLRSALGEGYPLHIDATCEHGKGGLFVCMDGWRGWVLVAGRIPSEHEDHLRPLVEETTRLFGDPIATVRDMGQGGANAVAPLREKGITDLICHYHFLAAVGKKLFEQPYGLLRRLLKSSKVRTDLRALLRDLRGYSSTSPHEGRFGEGVVRSTPTGARPAPVAASRSTAPQATSGASDAGSTKRCWRPSRHVLMPSPRACAGAARAWSIASAYFGTNGMLFAFFAKLKTKARREIADKRRIRDCPAPEMAEDDVPDATQG